MRKRLPQLALFTYFFAWFSYFAWFWSQALKIDDQGNVQAGLVNIWGDWAAHFTMGSAIGFRQLFLSESPFLIGARFSYPFAANFLSGLLLRIGFPFFSAFLLPSFIFSCLLIVALFYFFRTLLRSQWLAIAASLIFIFNGGLGFYYFGQDILNSTQPWQTLMSPPHEYTRLDSQQIKWISVIDSMVIPQRAFNLGFPLTLLALALIYQTMFIDRVITKKKLIIASLILGVMPIVHTHSFLAAGFILFFWLLASFLTQKQISKQVILQRIMDWSVVGSISLGIAIPIYLYFFAEQTQGFLKWYPGWLAKEYDVNWFVFWFKNWGITPLLGLSGLTILLSKFFKKNRWQLPHTFLIWLPFWLLFCLINVILFQPFVWDNTKLLVWASVGFSALAAITIRACFKAARQLKRPLRGLATIGTIGLFAITTASGAIDAYWDLRTDLHTYQMYSAEEMELVNWVKNETPADAVWLTGDQHNHWLFNLTGRQSLLTYRGWLWTHGYDYAEVEKDVRSMYQDPTQKELYTKYGVAYVVVGPNEIRVWGAHPLQFGPEFTQLKQTPNYVIYSIEPNQ